MAKFREQTCVSPVHAVICFIGLDSTKNEKNLSPLSPVTQCFFSWRSALREVQKMEMQVKEKFPYCTVRRFPSIHNKRMELLKTELSCDNFNIPWSLRCLFAWQLTSREIENSSDYMKFISRMKEKLLLSYRKRENWLELSLRLV